MNSPVNISMVTYNRLELTKKSIQSILEKTLYPYYLTIVDNNSKDGTVEYLKDLYHQGKIKNLILLEQNLGVATAANLAWQMEDTELYVKFDNDMQALLSTWLSALVRVIENVHKVGILGYNFKDKKTSLEVIRGFTLRKSYSIGGGVVIIPRRTKDKIGYWREDYGPYGQEDGDYSLRVNASGMLCAYLPDTEAINNMQMSEEIEYRNFKDDWAGKSRQSFLNNWKNYGKDNCYIKYLSDIKDFEKYVYTE
jgi:GT2 family glycosyltransferase